MATLLGQARLLGRGWLMGNLGLFLLALEVEGLPDVVVAFSLAWSSVEWTLLLRSTMKFTSSPVVARPDLGYWQGRLLPWIGPQPV